MLIVGMVYNDRNGPFAAAGWEFREQKLGKSTKDY
jgi:hypothetical protein